MGTTTSRGRRIGPGVVSLEEMDGVKYSKRRRNQRGASFHRPGGQWGGLVENTPIVPMIVCRNGESFTANDKDWKKQPEAEGRCRDLNAYETHSPDVVLTFGSAWNGKS